MKKIFFGIPLVALLMLTSCNKGHNSSSESSYESIFNSEISSSEEKTLEEKINEVKQNIENTSFVGFTSYSFKGNKTYSGSASFYLNGFSSKGSAEYEEEGTQNFVVYKILDDKKFYDIDTYQGKKAKRYDVVSKVDDKTTQILESDVNSTINEYPLVHKDWFNLETLNALNIEQVLSFNKSELADGYKVNISTYPGEFKTLTLQLTFNANNQLISGDYDLIDWGKDNFDSEKKTPLDVDQAKVSETKKKVELELGDLKTFSKTEIKTLDDTYFVKSIDEVIINSSNSTTNFVVEAGEYVNFSLEKYSPATALNYDEFAIIETSNPEVISISSFGSVKAESVGECILTVANEARDIKKEYKVSVIAPKLTALYWKNNLKTLEIEPNEVADIGIEVYPTQSLDELGVKNSNEEVLSIISISKDRTYISVKGLKEGTTNLSLYSTLDPSIKTRNDLVVNVKVKPIEGDTSFLIGSWTSTVESNSGDTFVTTMTFFDDHSGKVEQKVSNVATPNSAEFTWSYYNSVLAFEKWDAEVDYDYGKSFNEPTNLSVSDDKTTITFKAKVLDSEGDYVTLTFNLKKSVSEVDVSWLIGSWEDEDNNITIEFKADKSATFKMGIYGSKIAFNWSYDGKNLTFTNWSDDSTTINSISLNSDKTKITLKIDDYDEIFTSYLLKL